MSAGENSGPGDEATRWRATIRGLIAALPEDFPSRQASMRALHTILHEELAVGLQASLDRHFKDEVPDGLDERRDFATSLNELLRAVGLAFECPRTRKPAILVVDFKDRKHRKQTRFRLMIREGKGGRTYTFSSVAVPSLTLMADNSRVEALARSFRSRISKDRHR